MANSHVWKRGSKYYFRAVIRGKRYTRSLGTSNRQEATQRAAHVYRALLREEWQPTRRPPQAPEATVGEVVDRYLASSILRASRRTRCCNVNYVFRLLKVGYGLEEEEARCAPLSRFTADLVRRWQESALEGIPDSAVMDRDRAAVTANSGLRQARSLFAKRVMEAGVYEDLRLPCLDRFMRAPLLRELPRDEYLLPREDVLSRLMKGVPEVRDADPAVWVAFVLCSRAGLRRGEVIAARWGWLEQPEPGLEMIRVQVTEDWAPKNRRGRLVPLPAGTMSELREVLGPLEPGDRILPVRTVGAGYKVFRRLSEWMLAQGWNRRQKAHELRKVFATAIAAGQGGYAAQAVLGHADLKTTARYAARPAVKAVDPFAPYAA